MLTLRYFGPFEAFRDGAPVRFPTRPSARLLALLATEPGHRWRRESVAAEIWPEAEYGSESVSLRTALAMLRRVLGEGVIGADREWVWIEANLVVSDRAHSCERVRRERIEPDPDRRESLLSELAESTASFLEGWDAPWIIPLRHEHAREVARAALELSRQRLASGLYEEARRLALRSLGARPGNAHAVAVAMRAAAALGERDEALVSAARASESPELRDLAREIEVAPAPAIPIRAPDVLFDAFEDGLRADPVGAVRFLMTGRSHWWRQRDIARVKDLLRMALEAEGLPDDLRAKSLHTLAMYEYRTGDFAATLATERAVLALEPTPDLRNDVRMTIGAVFVDERRWDEADTEMESHLALMATEPRDYRTNWVQLNQGHAAMERLDFAEARRLIALSRGDFCGDEFRRRYGEAHADTYLAAMALEEGDLASASRYAVAAAETLTVRVDPHAASHPAVLALLVRAVEGDPAAGARLALAPLDPVRLGMRRVALGAFDHAALGFAHQGRGAAARELLRATDVLRTGLGHPRSPLEVAWVERAGEVAAGPEVPSAPTESYAALAAWTAARGEDH